MKYVRQEHIISTVCDEDIKDSDTLKDLFDKIRKDNIDMSITIRQGTDDWGQSKTTSYSQARLTKVSEASVDLCAYRPGGNMNLRNIGFEDIVEVRVIARKTDLLKKKADLTRLDYIDVGE